ncbi:MAG: hypothetical protein IGS49_22685 [Chlorogloeopsis fritschii C42_A2020_084]|uniref:hypothetical protein n=1 Tax=Chlorogloeopsis fritschii TaxID=1124 RepID=UPI0019E68CEF|nr:hypothetical protein [Chlorogloeopsis fritschii]MBF2008173.1 hypothetical protein [Chlorogloeopsis fritschii C42_A2020_084]
MVSPLAVLAVPVTMAKWRTRRAVSGVDATAASRQGRGTAEPEGHKGIRTRGTRS